MNLDDAYRFLNFVGNREFSGKTMQPREYNANLETATLELFNREYQKLRAYARENKLLAFQITEVGEPLRPFINSYDVDVIPANGKMSIPAGFVSARSLRGKRSGIPREIEIISTEHMNKRLSNPLERSLLDAPACILFSTYIHVYPNDMDNVIMIYLRRPRKPFYAYTQDANTDLPTYIPMDEVRNTALITISTPTDSAIGDTSSLTVTETGGSANDIILGTYTADEVGEALKDITAGYVAAINLNNKSHGYEAEVVSASAGTFNIIAPIGLGDTANTFTTAVANSGTNIAAAVTTDFDANAAGVDGSTQIEFDEIYHMEIYKLILANMGVNLSDDRLLAYQKEYQVAGI